MLLRELFSELFSDRRRQDSAKTRATEQQYHQRIDIVSRLVVAGSGSCPKNEDRTDANNRLPIARHRLWRFFVGACTGRQSTPEIYTVRTPTDRRPPPLLGADSQSVDLERELTVDPKLRLRAIRQRAQILSFASTRNPSSGPSSVWSVNAGSMQEDEDQLGLAHFVEHMAFNGTENFEKQELIDYLEGIGMKFGPDINAYTSFDETVYMLQIPTDDTATLHTAFQILEDWAHESLF